MLFHSNKDRVPALEELTFQCGRQIINKQTNKQVNFKLEPELLRKTQHDEMENSWVGPALDKLLRKGLGGGDGEGIKKLESTILIND